jgi:hypothetical protein
MSKQEKLNPKFENKLKKSPTSVEKALILLREREFNTVVAIEDSQEILKPQKPIEVAYDNSIKLQNKESIIKLRSLKNLWRSYTNALTVGDAFDAIIESEVRRKLKLRPDSTYNDVFEALKIKNTFRNSW